MDAIKRCFKPLTMASVMGRLLLFCEYGSRGYRKVVTSKRSRMAPETSIRVDIGIIHINKHYCLELLSDEKLSLIILLIKIVSPILTLFYHRKVVSSGSDFFRLD